MNVNYINPFLSATMSVFSKMLGCTLTRGQPYVKSKVQPDLDISGIIGLSGKAKGTVVLSLCRNAALRVTEVMLGERPDSCNDDVADAVGELANIIAGSAKAQLEHLALSVSLPSIITGKGHCVEFPRNVAHFCIPFTCDWGEISVEVGLTEETVAPAFVPAVAAAAAAAASPQAAAH